MPDAGDADDAGGNQGAARAGAGFAAGVRELPERAQGCGQQMGARREAAGRAFAEAAEFGENEGAAGDSLVTGTHDA